MNKLLGEKVIVCYLITKFDNVDSLKNFVLNYISNKSGKSHDLLICFKQLNKDQIKKSKDILKNLNYEVYNDNFDYNDYDLGSYKRVAQAYPSRIIFFLNGNSYPNCNNWLKVLVDNYDTQSIIGTSASNLSHYSSLKLKKFYKFLSFYFKLNKYKKNFNPFPNPHIRTTGFLIKSDDFLSFISQKDLINKEDAWIIESGKNGLTNYFKTKGFKIYVVNKDGDKFSEKNWKFSETFNYLSQKKSLISDNHTRKYLYATKTEKDNFQKETWGD